MPTFCKGQFISHHFSSIIIGIYSLIFGLVILGLEVVSVPPRYNAIISKYASFLHSFAGRGVSYLLAGVLLLNHYVLLYISGSIVAVIGILYFSLEFVQLLQPSPSMSPPSDQRYDEETQPVWAGGES